MKVEERILIHAAYDFACVIIFLPLLSICLLVCLCACMSVCQSVCMLQFLLLS